MQREEGHCASALAPKSWETYNVRLKPYPGSKQGMKCGSQALPALLFFTPSFAVY